MHHAISAMIFIIRLLTNTARVFRLPHTIFILDRRARISRAPLILSYCYNYFCPHDDLATTFPQTATPLRRKPMLLILKSRLSARVMSIVTDTIGARSDFHS